MRAIEKALSMIGGSDAVLIINEVRGYRMDQGEHAMIRPPATIREPLERIGNNRETWEYIRGRTTLAEYEYLLEQSNILFGSQ